MLPRVYDVWGATNNNLNSGKNYAISNIASLPTAFTTDFTKATLLPGAAQVSPPCEFAGSAKVSLQVLITAIVASFAKLTIQLQGSNIGGTATECWANIGAAVEPTAVGSTLIPLNTYSATGSDPYKRYKFYRVSLTAVTEGCTVYVIGFGYAES